MKKTALEAGVFALALFAAVGPGTARAQTKQPATEVPSGNLDASAVKALQRALRDWYKTDVEATAKLNEANRLKGTPRSKGKIRKLRRDASKLRSKARKSKLKFRDVFAKYGSKAGGKSGDLLSSVGDLLKIFDGCFPYKPQSNGGVVKEKWIDKKAKLGYAVRYPKGYKPGKSWPMVYVLPPRAKDGKKWADPKSYLETVWPKTCPKSSGELIVVCPRLPHNMDLSARVDPTKEDAEEAERRTLFLSVLGHPTAGAFNLFQVDTDRVYLEATGASCPFALRVATLFPDRFGGLILRNPEISELDDATVPENLNGIGVMLIADKDHEKNAKALEATLKGAKQQVAFAEAKGTAPFGAMSKDIATWLDDQQRQLFRGNVTLVPQHDRFRKAFWVEIKGAEYLSQVAMADRPRVEVVADRKTNRIQITGRNVSEVRLLLNDVIVDLDKKITLVLNGNVKEIQRSRSLPLVSDAREGLVVQRNDPRYLFVAQGTFNLPEAKSEKGEGENGNGNGEGAGKGEPAPADDKR